MFKLAPAGLTMITTTTDLDTSRASQTRNNVQKKFVDWDIPASPSGTSIAGDFYFKNAVFIELGTKENERVGRQISLTNVSFAGEVFWKTGGASGEKTDYFRLLLIRDTQGSSQWSNGQADPPQPIEPSTIWSFQRLSTKNRYEFLVDKTITLRHNFETDTPSVPVKFSVDLDINQIYQQADEITGDVLHLYCITRHGWARLHGLFRYEFFETQRQCLPKDCVMADSNQTNTVVSSRLRRKLMGRNRYSEFNCIV